MELDRRAMGERRVQTVRSMGGGDAQPANPLPRPCPLLEYELSRAYFNDRLAKANAEQRPISG